MILAPRLDPAAAKTKFDRGEAIPLDVTSSLASAKASSTPTR